jgi:hypothetical protein
VVALVAAALLLSAAMPATAAKQKSGKAKTAPSGSARCPTSSGAAKAAKVDEAPVTPNGPSAGTVVAQDATAGRPRVELVRYPRPSGEGKPWSQWGQGLVLADGRFLSAMGNHLGKAGNAYLFSYHPGTHTITRFADVRSQLGAELDWGYGKIHGQIVEGPCGEAYFSTYWGTRTGLRYTPHYRGDVLFRIDASTLALTSLGAVVPERGIPSLAGTPDRDLIYGEAVDPSASGGRDQGTFFAFDARAGKVVFRDDVPQHMGFRNVMVGPNGHAYVAAEGGRLLEYVPGASELRPYSQRLPDGGVLRASTAPARDGTVYGATKNPDRFFAFEPDGTLVSLGPAPGYTTSMAVEPDGSAFYAVPGAHGGEDAALIAVDPRTREQRTVVRLADLVQRELGLYTSGSYDVVLDATHRRLYVGLNAGPSADEPWGEVVLAIVDRP